MKKKYSYNNNQKNFKRNTLKETQKRQNTIFYLRSEYNLLSSFNGEKFKILNNIKKEKDKTITNNKTPENNINKNLKKKITSKINNKINKTITNNYYSRFIKIIKPKINFSLKISNNIKNKCINNKADIININKYIIKNSKNKIINNVNNFSKLSNKNEKLSKISFISLKKTTNNPNIKIKSIKTNYLSNNYLKRYNNNYSKSFLYTDTFYNNSNLIKNDFNLTFKNISEKENISGVSERNMNLKEKQISKKTKLNLLNKISQNCGKKLNEAIRNNLKKCHKKKNLFENRNKNLKNLKNLKTCENEIKINKNLNIQKKLTVNIRNSTSCSKLIKQNNENNNNNTNINMNKNINIVKSKNNNISSKQTIFSSYINSEKNLNSNDFFNQNKNLKNSKINILLKDKSKYKLNLGTESNDLETQEIESKFLNYELGVSDKISSINFNLDTNNVKNYESIKKEYEKPVEEIEEIADQILNKSNYRIKKISHLNNKMIDTKEIRKIQDIIMHNDTEELKNGEGIQNVFTLYIAHNKK